VKKVILYHQHSRHLQFGMMLQNIKDHFYLKNAINTGFFQFFQLFNNLQVAKPQRKSSGKVPITKSSSGSINPLFFTMSVNSFTESLGIRVKFCWSLKSTQ